MTPKTRTKRHLASLLCTVEVLLVHARSLYNTIKKTILTSDWLPTVINKSTNSSFVGSLADLGLLFKKKTKLVPTGYMCLLLSTNLWGCWQMGQELASLTSWLLSANCRVANISSWTPCSFITLSEYRQRKTVCDFCIYYFYEAVGTMLSCIECNVSIMRVRINKWSCINIRNQSEATKISS